MSWSANQQVDILAQYNTIREKQKQAISSVRISLEVNGRDNFPAVLANRIVRCDKYGLIGSMRTFSKKIGVALFRMTMQGTAIELAFE